ncbi:MAG: hypothetical protein GXZ04_08325 [Clostridiales bacterium]|nr:hypothetical protein [Clostridiales bacterium]
MYDRLISAQPIKQTAQAHLPETCLIRKRRISLKGQQVRAFTAEIMSFISNQNVQIECKPEELLFLDTETTGLARGAGTIAFLIGYGQIIGDELHITQVLMRDYHQEILLLEDFLERVKGCRCLLTYNGASFDLPLLQSRLIMNRLQFDLSNVLHLDLLHAARRIFKLRLGRCPLNRMEELVFNFTREDDLPGSEVPGRFFEYLKHRDEGLLEDVLRHNDQDIITLSLLFLDLVGLHTNPLETPHQQDLLSLGTVYEKQGHHTRAIACYRACSDQAVLDIARLRTAEIYRKQRRDQEAADEYETLRQSRAVNPKVFISLAKIYEHRFKDPARALEIARQGMLYCSERIGFFAAEDRDYLDLQKRSLRLMRKVENSG